MEPATCLYISASQQEVLSKSSVRTNGKQYSEVRLELDFCNHFESHAGLELHSGPWILVQLACQLSRNSDKNIMLIIVLTFSLEPDFHDSLPSTFTLQRPCLYKYIYIYFSCNITSCHCAGHNCATWEKSSRTDGGTRQWAKRKKQSVQPQISGGTTHDCSSRYVIARTEECLLIFSVFCLNS